MLVLLYSLPNIQDWDIWETFLFPLAMPYWNYRIYVFALLPHLLLNKRLLTLSSLLELLSLNDLMTYHLGSIHYPQISSGSPTQRLAVRSQQTQTNGNLSILSHQNIIKQ